MASLQENGRAIPALGVPLKRICRFVAIFACAYSLDAQVAVVLNRLNDGWPEIEIQNNSSVNLTAFAVSMLPRPEVDANTRPFIVFVDAAFDTDRVIIIPIPHPREAVVPLPPNEKYTVPVTVGFRGGRMVDLFEPPVISAIFADGSTTGDAALLSRLVARRGSMLQAVELAREILAEAGRHNVPRDPACQTVLDDGGFAEPLVPSTRATSWRHAFQIRSRKADELATATGRIRISPFHFCRSSTHGIESPACGAVGIAT